MLLLLFLFLLFLLGLFVLLLDLVTVCSASYWMKLVCMYETNLVWHGTLRERHNKLTNHKWGHASEVKKEKFLFMYRDCCSFIFELMYTLSYFGFKPFGIDDYSIGATYYNQLWNNGGTSLWDYKLELNWKFLATSFCIWTSFVCMECNASLFFFFIIIHFALNIYTRMCFCFCFFYSLIMFYGFVSLSLSLSLSYDLSKSKPKIGIF